MNSSKVNTRGLQHFHPINFLIYYIDFKERKREKKQLFLSRKHGRSSRTFLPLVKDRWTRVVMTLLFWVSIFFAAALADTLLRHGEGGFYGTMAGITMEKEAENRAA